MSWVVVGLLDLSICVAAAAEPPWLDEARAAWKTIGDYTPVAVVSAKETTINYKDGKVERSASRVEWKRTRDAFLVHSQSFSVDDKGKRTLKGESVACRNPQYAFTLHRKRETDDWIIRKLAPDEEVKKGEEIEQRLRRSLLFTTRESLLIWHYSLPYMVEQEWFHINKWRRVEREGREVVELEFIMNPENKRLLDATTDLPVSRITGKCWLDPQQSWQIVAHEYHLPTWMSEEVYELSDVVGITRRVVKKDRVRSSVHADMIEETTRDVTANADIDPGVFRLPHYGIPEPEEFRQSGLPWHWIAVIAGIVLILLAIVITRRKRRSTGAVP